MTGPSPTGSVLTVRAGSLTDLAREQGRRTATVLADRLAEDVAHLHAATGTAWDEVAAAVDLTALASRAFETLDSESQDVFAAYADGVGGSWWPWTPLGVFAVHHLAFGTYGHDLWRRHVVDTLGPDAARHLAHEVTPTSGSNAWVAGGERTVTGRPMIGADPHRRLTWPGVYQRVHLVAQDAGIDVVGLTFPGVPLVQHFGHTGTVAWAVTNAMAKTQADDLGLRWNVVELGDLGLSALLPLVRARTLADVDAALDHWVEPVNDVLVADSSGAVLHRVAGRVPLRDAAGTWSGWAELPSTAYGPDAVVVSANHRRGPESAVLADEFAPPHRARRLEQLLAGPGPLDHEAAEAVHRDTLLLPAVAWQARLARLVLDPGPAADLRDELVAWDGRMHADSPGAGAFGSLREEVVRRLCVDPALAPLADAPDVPALWGPWLRPEPRVALALDRWLDEGPSHGGRDPLGLDLDAHLTAALEAVAAGPRTTWGEQHVVDVPGRGTMPVSGDDGCVWSTAAATGVDATVWRGPVARLVWDLADRRRSRWSVPDDVDDWLAGRMREVGV